MPSAKAERAHPSARLVLNQAIQSAKGIRVTCESHGRAVSLRHQCYTVRLRQREANGRRFPDPDHPLHDASDWDELEFRIEGNVLVIDKGNLDDLKIEEIL